MNIKLQSNIEVSAELKSQEGALASQTEVESETGGKLRASFEKERTLLRNLEESDVKAREVRRDAMYGPRVAMAPQMVDHTDVKSLMSLEPSFFFCSSRQRALGYGLWRTSKSSWLKRQYGYVDRLGIAAASVSHVFDGGAFCRCGQRGRFCKMADFCPRCNLDQRVDLAVQEYGNVFDKAAYWLAIVASSSCSPERAGLHVAKTKHPDGKTKDYDHPFLVSNEIADPWSYQPYTSYPEDSALIERICLVPFKFADRLLRAGLIYGAYVTREMDLDFRPHEPGADQTRVAHTALAHGNLLVNTTHNPTCDLFLEMYLMYIEVCQDMNVSAWPDLFFSQLSSQLEIKRWVSYELKPMPFHVWYKEGLLRGCDVEALNLEFNQVLFSGIKCAFGRARSPGKLGNLYCQSKTYIGNKLPPRVRNKDLDAWLKDPKVQAAHPEWEAAVIAREEKRARRRGGRPARVLPAHSEDLDESECSGETMNPS